ncbi:undecaprenyl-diphosphate phosphatase [Candidatus Gottesmanbacteria bacterium]|nr:undecaprenyl-diphosphate phosphatase [Candidatus Gottesmanbacteria bacterium]
MNYLQTIILSIVEGITEFLPISSTGHLILTSDLLKISQTEFQKSFEIIIQLGAILSVVVIYFQTLLRKRKIWEKVLVAFLPTGVLGFTLYKLIKHYLLGNTVVVLLSLFIGGIVLIILEKMHNEEKSKLDDIEKISLKNAFFIGLFQSISMIPGVSRAAATIFGGLYLGLNRKTAVEFSFLLAIPTMLAATVLDLYKSHLSFTSYEYLLLAVGFAGAFITAFVTVKYFLRFIQSHTFVPFGIYRVILAVAFWVLIVR